MSDAPLNAAAPGADRGGSRTSETQKRSISDYSTSRVLFQATQQPAPNLEDIVTTRMLIYGRLLAGSALAFPVEAMAAYEQIDHAAILDPRARDFLDTLELSKEYMRKAPDLAEGIAMRASQEKGEGLTIGRWAADAAISGLTSLDMVRRLAASIVTLDTLYKLKDELADGVDRMAYTIINGGVA